MGRQSCFLFQHAALQSIFLSEGHILLPEVLIRLDQFILITVCVELAGFQPQLCQGDIGAVVRNTLQVCNQIAEHKILGDIPLPVPEPFHLPFFDFIAEVVDRFFKRFDIDRPAHIPAQESICRNVQDLTDCADQHRQVMRPTR